VRIIDLERKTGEELHLCFCWNGGRDTLLEIGVEQFVGIQFRRVAGQVEDLDLVRVQRFEQGHPMHTSPLRGIRTHGIG
jgi:hypothetical protein